MISPTELKEHTKLMDQQAVSVKNHLNKHGFITESKATLLYGVKDLSEVISTLHDQGFPVSDWTLVRKPGKRSYEAKYELA